MCNAKTISLISFTGPVTGVTAFTTSVTGGRKFFLCVCNSHNCIHRADK